MKPIPGPLLDTTPFVDMDIWQYLKGAPREKRTVRDYLRTLGFEPGVDKIEPDQWRFLQYAVEHFLHTAPVLEPMKFEDAFTPVSGFAQPAYYVGGKPGHYKPAPAVLAALEAAGWIYEPDPRNTYFEIVEGKMWARYQQILGSRALFEIVP